MTDVTIFTVSEKRIDYASAEAFQDRLLSAVGDGSRRIVLDFGQVEAISSIGLRALIVASKRSAAAGDRIAIAALQPLVREIFIISRFDVLFRLFDTVDEARAALEST